MSRLNYNKWDAIELSDDSDIETHPNVDKKSMIRWKQRDIHEKRETRKLKLHHLALETQMNSLLLTRIQSILTSTKLEGSKFISRTIAELKVKVPDYTGKTFKDGEQPSQDHMILSLLTQVVNAVSKTLDSKGKDPMKDIEVRDEELVKEIEVHEKRLIQRQIDVKKEIEVEEKEQKKHITTDDMHMGFETKTMMAPVVLTPPPAAPKVKTKKVVQETSYETINSPALAASLAGPPTPLSDDSESESDAATLTPAALSFSKIKPLDFGSSYQAISNNPSLLTEDTTDALLVEAFSVAMRGEESRARECVEKGLVIQYCRQLGRDGVAQFFRKMTAQDPKALKMFLEDVATTSARIIARAKVIAEEKASAPQSSREQIQLVPSSDSTTITFEVPDGPPPSEIVIEGEGSEGLDPVLVRDFLMRRWEMFDAFPIGLKRALASKDLEKVNKVLGKMEVEDAEEVVKNLQESGILNFEGDGEIRDMTNGQNVGGGEEIATGSEKSVEKLEKEVDDVVLD